MYCSTLGRRGSFTSSEQSVPAVVAEALDFVQRLPPVPDMPSAVALLQATAGRAEVGVVGLVISGTTAASQVELSRMELQATLRGPYAGLRDVLAQMSAPGSAAVLRALTIRRVGATGELEAQITWWLPSRPA
jgi:hypothetical protein